MPATFADVYDLYRNNPSFAKLSLRDFAKLGNLVSGGQEFDVATGGAFDQTAKKASYWLDQGIDLTGVPDATGYVGRAVYDIFGGDPARGEAMGRSLPREALNFLPMVFAPTAGAGLVAGMAGSGALGALNAWEKTDDALSAATGAVAPFVGHAAARVGGSLMARHVTPRLAQAIPQLQKFGFGQGVTRVVEEADKPIEQLILSRMGDKAMASVGEQAGATIGMEGLNAATGGWRSWAEDPYNTALDAIFSGLAFAPVELAGLRGNKVYERALKPTVALPVKAAEAPSVEAEITRDFLPTSPERVELARKEVEYLNERDTVIKALNMSEEERISRLGQINDKYGFAVDGVKGAGPEKDKVNGVDAQAIIQAAKQSFHDDPLIKAALEAKKSDLVANEEMLTQDAIDAAGLREKYRQAIEAKDDVALWGIRKDAMQHRKTRLETPLELPIQKKPDDILNPQVATDELAKANVVRDELELPIVDDVEIEARISDEVEAGESVDDAAKTVVASVVNETSESVKTRRARGRPKGSGKKTTPALEALGSSQAPIDKKALEGLAQLQKAKGYITAMQLDSAVKLWQDARADSNLTLGKSGPKIAELDEAGQLNALMKYVGAIPNRESMPKANPTDYAKDASGKRQKFKDEPSALAKANELSQSLHDNTRWTVRKQGSYYYVAKVPKGDVSLDAGIDVSDVVAELPPATEKVQDVDHKRASRVIDDAVVERILALGDDDQIISLFEANPNVTGALIEEQLERLRATTPMILLPNRAKREAFKEVARIVRERDVAGIKKLAKLAASERVDTSRDSFFSGKDAGRGELNGLRGNIGKILAGDTFYWGLAPYDKTNNKIGKHTLPKNGVVSTKVLKLLSEDGQPLQEGEIEYYKQLVPEAFEGENVNLPTLYDKLSKLESQIKAVTYGQESQVSQDKAELDQLTHEWYDTLPRETRSRVEDYVLGYLDEGNASIGVDATKLVRYKELRNSVQNHALSGPRATSYYNQISPFDTKKFPVLRVDVVLSDGPRKSYEESLKEWGLPDTPGNRSHYERSVISGVETNKPLWQQDNLHENLPNTLGWAMVQIVPDPKTGEKVMFVGEAQSRWGQTMQAQQKLAKNWPEIKTTENLPEHYRWEQMSSGEWVLYRKGIAVSESFPTKEEALTHSGGGYVAYRNEALDTLLSADHPLLPIHQNLILKSVIKEAQKQGITKVAISDGETAMMTEGHDKGYTTLPGLYQIPGLGRIEVTSIGRGILTDLNGQEKFITQYNNPTEWELLEKAAPRGIKQAKGMRLAYDTTLPSIMKKLVGEGQLVEFGEHKNLVDDISWDGGKRAGSPVFKNADGTPKSSVTARLYDISNVSPRVDRLFGNTGKAPTTSSLREFVREATNFDSLVSSILRRQGMTDDAIETVKPAFTKIKDWLSIDDAALGELVEHNFKTGQDFLGFATNRGARRAMILGVGDGITKMKPADQARALSFVLAHEAGGHLVEHLYNQKMLDQKGMKAFDEFNTWTQKATPAERAETLDLLAESFLTKEMRDNATISQMLKTSDPEEARATMLGMWSLATATGGSKNADLGLLLAPREVRNVWSTMARYARKVWSSIKGAMFGDSEWRTKASKLRVDELVKSFETIRKSADRASKMVQDFEMFTGLDAHSYKNLRGNVGAIADDGSAVPSVRKLAADLDLREGAPGPIKRVFDDFVQPLEQLAETVPQVREATYALLKAPMQLKQSIVKAMAPLLGDWNAVKAEFSKGIEAKEYKRVVNPNNKASEVFSQIKLKEQELQSSIDWNSLPAEIQAEMNKLTPSDQTAVRNVYERHKASVSELQKDVVRKYDEIGVNVLASYLTSRDSTLFKDAHKAAYLLKAAYKAGLEGDENTRAYHLAQVMDLVPQENTRLQAMAIAQEQVASIRELEEFFAKRPWFASLTRHGKFFVKAKDAQGKDISNQAFYDEGSYNKWKAEKQAQGATEFVRSKIERGVRANIDDTLGEAVKKVESRLMSVIDDSSLSDDNKANMKESLDLVGELRRYQAARQKSFGPERTRRIAEGADELNLLSTHHKYVDLVARKMSNGVMKSRWAFESSNPELVFKYAPELERIKTGIEHYMQPDSQFARAITKLNAVNFLGFNFVNALQEGFQSLFTHVHQLRADGMKYGEAAKLLAGTAGNIINFYSAGKGDLKNWKDPNERAMLLDSAEKGLIGYGAWTEIDENRHIENVLNARYLAKNGWQEKLPDWGRKGIRAYADMSLALFKVTSMFNAKMALLSAYRHARKTMGHYEATEYAQRFSTNVNQAGGRAGRPIGQGSMGAFGPVVYALNRYNLGVTAMMSRFLRHGFQGEAFGKTPRQRADARAAATGMIGMQLAAAGALGLPFMGPATALFEKLSGVDIKGSIYEFFGETLDEDSKDGGILADIVMNGAANALGERVGLPLDFSSRYAIGGVPGVSQLEGVSADSIFGATGALVKQIATGVHKYLAEEDIVGGTKAVMPPGLRKAFDLWANGDATSTSGKHLGLEEGMEKWLYAGGFTPSRIRKLQQFDRLNRRNEEIRRSKDVRTVSQVVDLFQTDPALARARLGQLMKEGNVDARKIALGVADSVVEKAFGPEDFRKSSTRFGAKEALALARGMGLPTEMGNEVARMRLKMKVMRTLGLSFRPNIARAQQYDQQSVTDPFAPFVPQA